MEIRSCSAVPVGTASPDDAATHEFPRNVWVLVRLYCQSNQGAAMRNVNDPNNINDPNYTNINDPAYTAPNARLRASEDRSYGGWIVGALVAVAVILGFVFLFPMTTPNTASNSNNGTTASTPVRPAPAATTGSGSTSPAPAAPTPAPKQ